MRYRVPVLICAIAAILLVAGCLTSTGGSPDGVPQDVTNPNKAVDAAKASACRANLRAIHSMIRVYEAENGRLPTMSELESERTEVPDEPAGGSYSLDRGTGAVTCSAGHGKYPE